MIRYILAFILLATQASADMFPALYNVVNVAADDVLNVRAEPDANTPIIGSFAPGQTGIEITARDPSGKWGRVNVDDVAGWASLRYLERWPAPDVPFAKRLSCFGTEPFWDVDLVQGGVTRLNWEGVSSTSPVLLDSTELQSAIGRNGPFAMSGTAPTGRITAILNAQDCSDGMSDRLYGLSVDLYLEFSGRPSLLNGCCMLLGH